MRAWLNEDEDQPARQLVNLKQMIDETLRLTGRSVEKVAPVEVDLSAASPQCSVPDRLSQVLANLLLNATAAFAGPSERNVVRIRAQSTDGHLVLEVEDTGSGSHLRCSPTSSIPSSRPMKAPAAAASRCAGASSRTTAAPSRSAATPARGPPYASRCQTRTWTRPPRPVPRARRGARPLARRRRSDHRSHDDHVGRATLRRHRCRERRRGAREDPGPGRA